MTSPLRNKILLGSALITGVAGLSSMSAHAEDAAFTAAQKAAMGDMVKEYLLENPSVVIDAIEAYRAQEAEMEAKKAEESIVDNKEYLTRANAPSVGNPEGDVTVVEFFDYNCGYCKRALPDIQKIVKEDPNVRFVFKEMPILGPTSKTAAQWALAAHRQDKYFEYHIALMEHRGEKSNDELEKLAQKIGLDVDKAKADIDSGEIDKELDMVTKVGREIGVSGTPAFIVGDKFIPGYIGEDGLKNAIAEERKKGG